MEIVEKRMGNLLRITSRRRVFSGGGCSRAYLLPDSASSAKRQEHASTSFILNQRQQQTYMTAASPLEKGFVMPTTTVVLKSRTGSAYSSSCRSALRWNSTYAQFSSSLYSSSNVRGGFFSPSQPRGGLWSMYNTECCLLSTGKKEYLSPSRPGWASQVAGMKTKPQSEGGGHDIDCPDEDGKMKVSMGKAAAAGTRGGQKERAREETKEDNKRGDGSNSPDHLRKGSLEEKARSLDSMRGKLKDFQDARLDASEDAKDWIRDKKGDMDEMRETLRDARRDGRLREELSDKAKKSRGRFQVLWRQYGAVSIGCYFGIYFGSIALFYGVYDYGVMTNLPSGGAGVIEHMQDLMKHTPESVQHYSDRLFGAMAEDHRARSLVLAWATCKVLEPLRLIAAIAVTPRVARALGRAPAKLTDDDEDLTREKEGPKTDGSGADNKGGGRAG